eukprot:TRINITY_DN14802_c0_g1_i1.p1 TRINITY_DN14802_c0_g1~~TRINITY_DN14802_c0_g1_i1.p1  ORF type:complete len:185 (-),score=51.37 TRINITY_DN14802_c0_g1_i1:280-834(-)
MAVVAAYKKDGLAAARPRKGPRSVLLALALAAVVAAPSCFTFVQPAALQKGSWTRAVAGDSRVARRVKGWRDDDLGWPVPLSEENVEKVLEVARWEYLEGCFGYSDDSLDTGITGHVDLVSIEGPFVTVRFSGDFWHPRPQVLARLEKMMKTRIPEIEEVQIEDPAQLEHVKKTFYHSREGKQK